MGSVEDDGNFKATYRALNVDQTADVEELEREFRAQIERALASGVRIDYLDNHMGAGMATDEQRAMMTRLSEAYGLPISGSLDEQRFARLDADTYEERLQQAIAFVHEMTDGQRYLMVNHLGTDTPEMRALRDANEGGVRDVARQRSMERNMLMDPRFRAALQERGVAVVRYSE